MTTRVKRLKEAQVQTIKRDLADGTSVAALARKYGVCRETVENIKFGRTWKHVGNTPSTTTPAPISRARPKPQWRKRPDDAKRIPGTKAYWVTPNGEVYSSHGSARHDDRVKLLRPGKRAGGYRSCYIRFAETGRRNCSVHLLVALAFLPPQPSPKHQIRHLDGDPANNSVSNLRWGTLRENAQDRDRHGRTRRGETSPLAKITEATAIRIRDLLKPGRTAREVAERLDVSIHVVQGILSHRTWRHLGPPLPDRKTRTAPCSGSKLTKSDVARIKWRQEHEDATDKELAIEFGVERQTIGDIRRGRTWRSIAAENDSDIS